MCGIAGYNISREVAERLTEEQVQKIGAIGWEYNLHRGVDAHGFMASYIKDMPCPLDAEEKDGTYHGMWHYKREGSGMITIDKGMKPLRGVPVALGLHTRDATVGSPSNKENNHPVNWGSTWVTHNGSLKQASEKLIKQRYVDDWQKDAPVVDSVVFPMILNEIKANPLKNIDQLHGLLDTIGKDVDGAYTLHTLWTHSPGVSLIAMGRDRPIVFAYHESMGVFVYSSEIDATMLILEEFGVSTEDNELMLGKLKDGQALLLDNGRVVDVYSFQLGEDGDTEYPTLTRRNSRNETLESNFGKGHWTKKAPLTSKSKFPDFIKGKFYSLDGQWVDNDLPQWWPDQFKWHTGS